MESTDAATKTTEAASKVTTGEEVPGDMNKPPVESEGITSGENPEAYKDEPDQEED